MLWELWSTKGIDLPLVWLYFGVFWVFVFGAIIGSFLNACIHRIPNEISLWKRSRSFCPQCEHALAWFDNIPLLSYIARRGRCGYCKVPIPVRYPLVEIVTATGFALIFVFTQGYNNLPVGITVAYMFFFSLLVGMVWIDLLQTIIPDELTTIGMILAPIFSYTVPTLHSPLQSFAELSAPMASACTSIIGIIVGYLTVWFVGQIGTLAFRKEAMGGGDMTMMGVVGGFLGPYGALLTFFLSPLPGLFVGIYQKVRYGDSHIPFGPYLGMSAVLVMFYYPAFLAWFYGNLGIEYIGKWRMLFW